MNSIQEGTLIKFTFLGQAGLIIENEVQRIVIDPYLSNYIVESGIGSAELFSREFPPPVQAENLKDIQAIFISHDHADHCDPYTLLPIYRANPHAVFICPKPGAEHLLKIGIKPKNILVPEPMQKIKHRDLTFYSIPAAHYGFDRDVKTGEFSYFGYAIQFENKWLFHAGDTVPYDELVKNILSHTPKIDIACLPVNGRNDTREKLGIVGNLDCIEAADLAVEINSRFLIPIHNDLFRINCADPQPLIEYVNQKTPGLKLLWLKPGENAFV